MIIDLTTWQVEGTRAATEAATKLIERSAWFQVEPRPFDWYSFSVKAGEGLEKIFNSLKTTGYEVQEG